MNNNIKKTIPIVLAIIGSVGVVGTSVLVAKETPKANENLAAIDESDKKKKLLKQSKVVAKAYWPAILCGVGTIGSVAASTIISKKTEASLIATATVLGQGWNKYKWKVKELLGPDVNKKITDAISKDDFGDLKKKETNEQPKPAEKPTKNVYWEEHLGYFECDESKFLSAMNDLNQRLHVPDADDKGTFYWTSLKIFAEDAKANVYEKERLEGCRNIGWTSDYLLEAYGPHCIWVHPYYTKVYGKESKKLLYTKVEFWEEPIMLAESEMSRFNYKSRKDFEHEADCDLRAASTNDESVVILKPDCDLENDDLSRLIPSDPAQTDSGNDVYYEEGE